MAVYEDVVSRRVIVDEAAEPTLAAEIAAGQGIGLAAAARLFPGEGGKTLSPVSLSRWCSKGVTTPSGEVVRLEAIKVGRKRITSRAALGRFLAKMAEPAVEPAIPAPPVGRAADKLREAEEAELSKRGL